MSELMVSGEFKYFGGEAYMHVDKVAEILHKTKSNVIRDVKVIELSRKQYFNGEFNKISTRQLQKDYKKQRLEDVRGVIVTSYQQNSYVKDVFLTKSCVSFCCCTVIINMHWLCTIAGRSLRIKTRHLSRLVRCLQA